MWTQAFVVEKMVGRLESNETTVPMPTVMEEHVIVNVFFDRFLTKTDVSATEEKATSGSDYTGKTSQQNQFTAANGLDMDYRVLKAYHLIGQTTQHLSSRQ